MRAPPTSRYLMLAIALLVGGAIVGCATSNGDGVLPEPEPGTEPATGTKSNEDDDERPVFEAGFDPEEDAGSNVKGDASSTPDALPPASCLDNDDPGGAENVAKVLPATDDCDDTMKPVNGVANGAVDVDFYKLSGADKTGCFTETDFESKTSGVELCVFARCKNSTANAVSGCASGIAATSDTGMKGCCITGPGHAVPEWDCSGISDDDSADFVIRVKPTGANSCVPYTFSYRF